MASFFEVSLRVGFLFFFSFSLLGLRFLGNACYWSTLKLIMPHMAGWKILQYVLRAVLSLFYSPIAHSIILGHAELSYMQTTRRSMDDNEVHPK